MAAIGPRTVAAILVAAGAGLRLGAGVPKAYVELWDEPLFVHSARALFESGAVDFLVVVVPDGRVDETTAALRSPAVIGSFPCAVVVGGSSRQASVARGLAAVPSECSVVLVHDAARALAPPGLIRSVAEAVLTGLDAVVPGLAMVDTVKQVTPSADGTAPRVVRTIERADLRRIQTPQGFRRATLEAAHAAQAEAGTDAGDDAGMVEATGGHVHVVPGDPAAFKITDHHDLLLARVFLEHA